MSAWRQSLVTVACVALPLTACQDKTPKTAEKIAASVAQAGNTTTWRCYDISVSSTEETRKITDLHFVLPAGSARHIKAPGGWEGAQGADGTLVFKTPPTAPAPGGGGTTVAPAPAPIDPGKSKDGFRFCLEKEQDNVTVTISYDKGADSPAMILQGVEAGSGKPIRRSSALHCYSLTLRAPSDADVSDMHLGPNPPGSDPGFDDVSPPAGWSGGATSGTEVALDAGTTPLKKGDSATIEVCARGGPSKIDWKFTDANHADIPGSAGTTTLTH